MSDKGLKLPNWREAVRHLELLTGEPDPVVCFQVFSDRGKGGQGAHRHGRLSSKLIRGWLLSAAKRGCGVYIVINRTDGKGRRRENITHYLASFIDLDKTPLPDKWHLPPDLVIESSAGKHHAYWRLEPGNDLATWEDTQKRLAAYYKADPKVCDAPRVLRLAGFDHQKGEPFRVRIIDERPAFGDLYTLDLVRAGLPAGAASTPAKATSSTPAPDVKLDTDAAVKSARSFLANAEQGEAGERNNTAYQHACKLNDQAISRELAEEMLLDWNDGQPDPLPESEIKHVVSSAWKYKQNAQAAAAPAEAEFDLSDEGGDDDGDAAAPLPSKQPGKKLDKLPVMRLNDVDEHNIGRLFRFVNLAGKPRVLYWGPSALDPLVRVPQFWSVPEFRQQLCNKFGVRVTQTTDADGETVDKQVKYPIADAWLRSPKRRIYDGVVLVREQHSDHPNAINLWRGYGFTPAPGDWSLMREHIRKVIAKSIPERDEYIIRWIAWALQHPELPCEVALILKSATHGTGKGALLRCIRKLFGAHGMQISKGALLTGRFNAHLSMTCLLFADEMQLSDTKESATLNSLLTEDAIAIEPKGIDSYMMPNHVKVCAASNQEHVVLIAGSDRRFAVFEVGVEHARDIPYFTALQDQLDAGGYAAMLYDLLEMDLDGWHPRQLVKDDKITEQVRSAPPELQWLAGYLDTGYLDAQVGRRDGDTVAASTFYERARRSIPDLRTWSDNRFASFLKNWNVESHKVGTMRWTFPPLEHMRSAWRKAYPWWPAFDQDVTAWRGEGDELLEAANEWLDERDEADK